MRRVSKWEKQFFLQIKVGIAAWYVATTLGGQKALKPWQLKIYGWLTPVLPRPRRDPPDERAFDGGDRSKRRFFMPLLKTITIRRR